MTVTMKLFAFFLFLAIPARLSTVHFALYANAWACVPISTSSRENASKSKAHTASRATTFETLKKDFFLRPPRPWKCRKRGSLSSILSSSTPFYDEQSTASLPNSTTVAPSTIESISSIPKPNIPSPTKNSLYFVRPAIFVDMDRASKILADGFFKGPNSNWLKYQYEKFITYLSLEANFPRTQQERSRYEIYVACCVNTGEVWGLVEIDARGTKTERTSNVYEKSGGSPYMCNLAVDERHKRKGIATSLVYECERQVKEWYSDFDSRRKKDDEKNIKDDVVFNSKNDMFNDFAGNNRIDKTKSPMTNSVCLKVRESNKAAVEMYLKLGYVTVFEELEDGKPDENILLMLKELPPLSPKPQPDVE